MVKNPKQDYKTYEKILDELKELIEKKEIKGLDSTGIKSVYLTLISNRLNSESIKVMEALKRQPNKKVPEM